MKYKTDLLNLYKKIGRMEVDSQSLKEVLKNYSSPNKKIHELVKNNDLIRLSKGFYIFNPQKMDQIYSKEVIANLLYGPSYISMEWALSYYGIIPERVEQVTSVTLKRSRRFKTPIGQFVYFHVNKDKYSQCVTTNFKPEGSYQIAEPEKALVDLIILRKSNLKFKTHTDIKKYLKYDLRANFENINQTKKIFKKHNLNLLRKVYYRNTKIRMLLDYLLEFFCE